MKNAIKFASYTSNVAVFLPEGAKGDMCRAVESDVQFGRLFPNGPNPVMLQRCVTIPRDKFPVTDDMLQGLLDRSKNLDQEAHVSQKLLAGVAPGGALERAACARCICLDVASDCRMPVFLLASIYFCVILVTESLEGIHI